MELDKVVPWGRSFEEYCSMFNLTEHDLSRYILGCSDGPASFNAELSQRDGHIISVDPVYQFNAEQLQHRINEVYPQVMSQVRSRPQDYIWQHIADPDALAQIRMKAMSRFLTDYETGRHQGRYIAASLPSLPFSDQQFDLALCSHFLFLYSEHINCQQHIEAILELVRVAREIRIYPLITLDNKPSPHLNAVMAVLVQSGLYVDICRVAYQFQQGADHMLVVRRAESV